MFISGRVNPVIFKNMFKVRISGEEYQECVKCSKGDNFWGNSKKGTYGQGLCRTEEDPFRPARIGKLGEMGFSKLFGLPFDNEYRQKGDRYDFTMRGYSIDIKTSKWRKEGPGLIMRYNEQGVEIPLSKDIYVFSYCNYEVLKKELAEVVYVGYCLKDDIQNYPVKLGYRGGKHKNIEVDFKSLIPIAHLYEWCGFNTSNNF
ncbi:MAG TPA: hypothetical protein VMW09_03235 [Desulfatiglandales bacterium]|nr:hypothetical protein [Desulfatiglandales bacterium]